jgi:large subunit ribosomal protein L25
MQTPTITAVPRERIGSRYARRLRQAGRLPAIIYGHERDPLAVSVDAREILGHLKRGTHVLNLSIQGGRAAETCLVKELQFGHLGDDIVHVDFARVDLEEEVHVHVALHFVGQPPAAQKAGAILSHDLTDLEVICRVNAIPEEIRVDLGQMGQQTVLTAGELALPPDIRLAGDAATPVVHVSFLHREEAVGEQVELAPAPAEPEVISETKAEERRKQEES